MGGGFSNEIVRIRLLDGPTNFSGPLVLRAMHDDDDAMRESVIQHGVAQAGFAAPPVLMRGTSRSPLERPFTISPLVAGKTFDELLNPTTALKTFRRLPAQLAETMSALHALPTATIAERLSAAGWPASRLDSLAVLGEVETQIATLHAPALMQGAAWLANHQPSFAPAVVCHGDLHPMNLLFEDDHVVAVLDWELARIGVPQHDLAELLCFALPAGAGRAELERWMEMHRAKLAQRSGVHVPRIAWRRGFRLALRQLLVERLPLYAVIHRFKPQPFLPRVVRNWVRLDELAESLEGVPQAA